MLECLIPSIRRLTIRGDRQIIPPGSTFSSQSGGWRFLLRDFQPYATNFCKPVSSICAAAKEMHSGMLSKVADWGDSFSCPDSHNATVTLNRPPSSTIFARCCTCLGSVPMGCELRRSALHGAANR